MSIFPHIGLIEGRHEMPVEGFLIRKSDGLTFENAHALCFRKAKEFGRNLKMVNLYLTGLTRAAIGAIMGFLDVQTSVNVWEYNRELDEFECVYTIEPGARFVIHRRNGG